jgi:hypothetical protein
MATINSATFDQASYEPGATMTLTVDYVPDTAPAGTPHTATVTITDAAGTVVATSEAQFTVAAAGSAPGDVVAVTDDASDTYTQVSDSGSVAIFTAAAPSA